MERVFSELPDDRRAAVVHAAKEHLLRVVGECFDRKYALARSAKPMRSASVTSFVFDVWSRTLYDIDGTGLLELVDGRWPEVNTRILRIRPNAA